MQQALSSIFNEALHYGKVPEQFLSTAIVPIYKKGSTNCWGNYRGISLMSVTAKLYDRLLLDRIRTVVDRYLRSTQNGFRQGRSTVHHVLAIRRIVEGCNTHALKCVATFIDFSKAFDSVYHVHLEAILAAYRVPQQIIAAIMPMYKEHSARVVTPFGETGDIEIRRGVLQGDTLSPYCFILVLDWVFRMAVPEEVADLGFLVRERTGKRTRGQPALYITEAAYADDIALLRRSC